MNRSLIISKTRVEVRRKMAGLQKERSVIRWIERFFDEMSIDHSSQIRLWQRQAFISALQSDPNLSREDILQARSSILFMYQHILDRHVSLFESGESDSEPGVFKITA